MSRSVGGMPNCSFLTCVFEMEMGPDLDLCLLQSATVLVILRPPADKTADKRSSWSAAESSPSMTSAMSILIL